MTNQLWNLTDLLDAIFEALGIFRQRLNWRASSCLPWYYCKIYVENCRSKRQDLFFYFYLLFATFQLHTVSTVCVWFTDGEIQNFHNQLFIEWTFDVRYFLSPIPVWNLHKWMAVKQSTLQQRRFINRLRELFFYVPSIFFTEVCFYLHYKLENLENSDEIQEKFNIQVVGVN